MDLNEKAKFLEKARRQLSAEELSQLKLYQVSAPTGRAKIVFIPIVRKWGDEIFYQARVYYAGVAGCLRLGKETLQAGEFPEEYLEKSRAFIQALNEAYSPLLALPEAKEEAKELAEEASVPSGVG